MANYQRLIGVTVGALGLGIGAYVTVRSGVFYGKYYQQVFKLLIITLVEPGHRAFKFSKISGCQEKIYREGWNFKIPLLERPVDFNV